MLIGARAIGSEQGYIYIRNEYPLALNRIQTAIDHAREYGLLGEDILGSGFNFDVKVIRGAGAFVCGEETSLIASVEGRMAEPRPRPPYPSECGLWGKPTNINNVETWANVPVIINRGAKWYSSIGTKLSKGTKVFSVVGKVKNTGLVEVPMGVTLGDIIFDICGGIRNDRKFKAVQIGGPSGGCIPKELLNLPVDYEKLNEAGAMMGSGGMVVTDENTCMVDMAHFFLNFVKDECCGKCTPCREGIPRMIEMLEKIKEGRADMDVISNLEELAGVIKDTALCGLGKTAPNPVITTLRYFKNEYIEHIKQKRCSAGVCTHLVSSPCHHTCPIETEASSYVGLVAHGKFQEALDLNRLYNPLPAVCSRVCHHPCEDRCRSGEIGDGIAVRSLKRFITDYERNNGGPPRVRPVTKKHEKVAIVGSGPAGLMAGWELGKRGYDVTIFESESVPGGMLAWGIPDYRLPKDILFDEIKSITNLGVKIRTSTRIGKDIQLEDLKNNGYKAIFIATGSPVNMKMGIPGEETSGVIDPIEFLKTYNLEKRAEIGNKVAVVGGGNTAIDAARTAWRLGADVTLLYRRTKQEMPAIGEEIDEALKEGIRMEFLTLPVSALSDNGRIQKVKCQRMELKEFDKSGRRTPVIIEGSDFDIQIDTFIPAIGQQPDLGFLNGNGNLRTTKWNTLEVDPESLMTNIPGIFAGGDVVSGPATVLEAMRHGKMAAGSIHRFLRGDSQVRDYKPTESRFEIPPVEMDAEEEEYPRPEMPKLSIEDRRGNFKEVELGFNEEQAVKEARRCFRCDLESIRMKGG